MGLMDDYYEMMDPFGVYDLDGDGHYDMDERFLIDEEERLLYEESISHSPTSLIDDEYDDDIISEFDDSILSDDLCDDDSDKELSAVYKYGGGTYSTQSGNSKRIKNDTKQTTTIEQKIKNEEDGNSKENDDSATKVMTFIVGLIICTLICVIPVGMIITVTAGNPDLLWLDFIISFITAIPITIYVMNEAEKKNKMKKGD